MSSATDTCAFQADNRLLLASHFCTASHEAMDARNELRTTKPSFPVGFCTCAQSLAQTPIPCQLCPAAHGNPRLRSPQCGPLPGVPILLYWCTSFCKHGHHALHRRSRRRKGMEPSGHGAGAIGAWAVCWAQPHQQLGDEVRQEAPPALNAQQANHGAGDDGNEGATASTGRTAQIMPCSVEQRFALIHPTYKYPRTPMLCRRVSGLTASSCGLFFAAMVLRCSRRGASAPARAPAFPRETALASTRLPTCAALAMNRVVEELLVCGAKHNLCYINLCYINMCANLLAFGIEAAHSQTRKAINNEQ